MPVVPDSWKITTEHVEKNLHLPQLVGMDNVLEYEMKGGDVMMVKFFVKKDAEGNEINSWYYETWKTSLILLSKVIIRNKILG